MIVDCALYSDGRRRHRLDDLRVAMREAEKEDGFVWIGLVEPTADEFDAIAEGFELPQLAIEDAIRAHQRPKLERYSGVTFAVVKPVHYVDHVEVVAALAVGVERAVDDHTSKARPGGRRASPGRRRCVTMAP